MQPMDGTILGDTDTGTLYLVREGAKRVLPKRIAVRAEATPTQLIDWWPTDEISRVPSGPALMC